VRHHLRVAAESVCRLAAASGRRSLSSLLAVVGSIALVIGVVLLAASLAPYFMNPSGGAAPPPLAAAVHPRLDPAVAIAPPVAVARLPTAPARVAAGPVQKPIDGVWFEISIPAVGYRAVVREGVGMNILALGPGHYPSTPWPGQTGNVAVAAHNSFWLGFSHLKPGDRVEIETQHGLYVYEITGSEVVSPTDRTVLVATNDSRLTLTTCYPLWAGVFATERLIFTAREIGGVA
jgi:LPXTG-site transpeptidase (sortase) family protein